MEEIWAVFHKFHMTFCLILPASIPTIVHIAGVGIRISALFIASLSKQAPRCKANGGNLVVKLAMDYNREVNICDQNSRGWLIDHQLSVCARLLLNFVGSFVGTLSNATSDCNEFQKPQIGYF